MGNAHVASRDDLDFVFEYNATGAGFVVRHVEVETNTYIEDKFDWVRFFAWRDLHEGTTNWICSVTMLSIFVIMTLPHIHSVMKYYYRNKHHKKQQTEALTNLLSKNDVWAYGVFPFLSSTDQFVSLADACHDLKVLVTQENAIVNIIKRKDIWMNILSFVGPGHYIYVAGVCKNLKTFYKAYFASLPRNVIPMVRGRQRPTRVVTTTTLYSAIFSSLDCLHCAHENGFLLRPVSSAEWTVCRRICAFAARIGNLDCLRYARENGCPWDERTCFESARGGYLDCLKYARQDFWSCPWNETVTAGAAAGGNLAVLKWLREQDHPCPWDFWTCYFALKGGNLPCFNYAIRNGCPCPNHYYERASDAGAIVIREGGRRYLVLQEQEEEIQQLIQHPDGLSAFHEELLAPPPSAGLALMRGAIRGLYF